MTDAQRRVIPGTVSKTINETLTTARKEAAEKLADELGPTIGLTSGGFKQSIALKRSTRRTLTGILSLMGRATPLYLYKARQTKRGVTAVAWGKRKLHEGVFIATAKRGKYKKTVYKRIGKDRGNVRVVKKGRYAGRRYRPQIRIKQLYGPNIGQVFHNPEVLAVIRRVALRRFPIVFKREMQFRLGKI